VLSFFGRSAKKLTEKSFSLASKIIAFTVTSSFVQSTMGSRCFQKDEHFYTLISSKYEDSIFDILKSNCSTYTTDGNDCANFITDKVEFGKAFFGGSICELIHHSWITPDICITDTLQRECHSGYGSTSDILATVGIAVGSVAVIVCCGAYMVKYCCNRRATPANDDIPLQSIYTAVEDTTVVTSRPGMFRPAARGTTPEDVTVGAIMVTGCVIS
jgi:hypothetical protein